MIVAGPEELDRRNRRSAAEIVAECLPLAARVKESIMPEWLYPAGPNSGLAFLFGTLILGGLAALASGRALADTWRPVWQLPMYMLALAAAVR